MRFQMFEYVLVKTLDKNFIGYVINETLESVTILNKAKTISTIIKKNKILSISYVKNANLVNG